MTPSGVDDALDAQPVGALESRQHAADRVGQLGDLLDAARDRLDALRIERQPVEKGGRRSARPRVGDVERIGGEDASIWRRISLAAARNAAFLESLEASAMTRAAERAA